MAAHKNVEKDHSAKHLEQPPITHVSSDSLVNRQKLGQGVENEFRKFRSTPRNTVRELYRLNHTHQTLDFVLSQKNRYLSKNRFEMGIWQALERLNSLVDDSDPDIELPQLEHALQTAEAIRRDHHPRWFVLVGLIHDLGKVLCLYDEPQWAVVGDTFPVGCEFSDQNIFFEFFADNSDSSNPTYRTQEGIYAHRCGLDNVHFSWGHDEYLYQVTRGYLPDEALYMIRYHSCYVIHREGAYNHLLNDRDEQMMRWVRLFSPYDLYSKSPERIDPLKVKPYYEDLIAEYLPDRILW